MNPLDVSDFVIVPPAAARASILEAQDQVVEYLCRKFPGYGFQVAPMAPVQDDGDYIVIPVMGFLTDDGKGQWCNPPPRWLLRAIGAAMHSFSAAEPIVH